MSEYLAVCIEELNSRIEWLELGLKKVTEHSGDEIIRDMAQAYLNANPMALKSYKYMGVMYYKHTTGYYYLPSVSMKSKTHCLIEDWIETDIKGEF